MTDTPTGRDLDRAIAELMPAYAFPAGVWMIGSESGTKVGPYHKSLDALSAGPEKVLRDAGWQQSISYDGEDFTTEWFPLEPNIPNAAAYAPTEADARAAAVYAGLLAKKEAAGSATGGREVKEEQG